MEQRDREYRRGDGVIEVEAPRLRDRCGVGKTGIHWDFLAHGQSPSTMPRNELPCHGPVSPGRTSRIGCRGATVGACLSMPTRWGCPRLPSGARSVRSTAPDCSKIFGQSNSLSTRFRPAPPNFFRKSDCSNNCTRQSVSATGLFEVVAAAFATTAPAVGDGVDATRFEMGLNRIFGTDGTSLARVQRDPLATLPRQRSI